MLKRVVFAAAPVLGLLACSSSASNSSGLNDIFSGPGVDAGLARGGFAGAACTEDAGVLTPIGPDGCGASQTVVYRKPLVSSSGGSAITSGSGAGTSTLPAMVTACADTTCGPGQVAVVTYKASPGDPLVPDGGGSVDAAPAIGDGTAPAEDGGDAGPPDGAASLSDGDASPPLPTSASDGAAGSDDGGVIAIPCNMVVTCVDTPPTCPDGQSPSYAPSGKWHCMPNCDPKSSDTVIITYGATYGNTSICAGAPPTEACPTHGQVWTWDYEKEEWVCAPECDNGQYDQHVYKGQTICVPC
jgi:hypothetical protein